MSDSGREWPSERPISREALMKTIENLTVSNERLIRELDQWKTWGIIEIAVRNPNVASYMEHWEGRATKAEESLAHKEYYDAMRAREIEMSEIPEKQRPFVTALLSQRDDFYQQMKIAKDRDDKLLLIIAKSDIDCIYCGLPKKDITKCAHGFPGCGRADDLLMEDTNGTERTFTV